MLWQEMVYLRDGSEPQGADLHRKVRLNNIGTMTNRYRFWTQKDVRPRRLWDRAR